MQLTEFEVRGLFRHFDHVVPFPPRPPENAAEPSLVLLHGQNGVGKTTLLRMLDGLMLLDFDVFRRVPFGHCSLRFTTGDEIVVESPGKKQGLVVRFAEHRVVLTPALGEKGALDAKDAPLVDEFRANFFTATEEITFELIGTARHPAVDHIASPDREAFVERTARATRAQQLAALRGRRSVIQREREAGSTLGERIRRFISEAQVEYRQFFTTTEPDLFAQIIHRLRGEEQPDYKPNELARRLQRIRAQDDEQVRLGIEPDRWDLKEITSFLRSKKARESSAEGLGVVGAYVEMLESRARERDLVAQRLLTFERLMNDFYLDKTVRIDRRRGLNILTEEEEPLAEDQLSSGEYHLLYLMISALLTRSRGTVLAIDEPEMSMHIAWQRKLIRSLIECASNAAPQFIFATHSPDVVGHFASSMIRLGPEE